MDAATDDIASTTTAKQTPLSGVSAPNTAQGEQQAVQPSHPRPSLSVVSESKYRCVEETAPGSIVSECQLVGLQSISSKLEATSSDDAHASPESRRPIKIIVMSDYVCAFCYICDKVLHDAIEACQDLPVQFNVEFRPFTLVNPSVLQPDKVLWRNHYLANRFGKEQSEMKLKAVDELSRKAGLELADDNIVAATTQAHRLAMKAYEAGGSALQYKFNMFIFEACLAKKANLGDEAVLVDAAVSTGLMTEEKAKAFLRSTECLDCVEKMVQAARAQGINGVPFVIIDGKWAVNGLQSKEYFTKIFSTLARLHAPPTAPGKTKTQDEAEVQQDTRTESTLAS